MIDVDNTVIGSSLNVGVNIFAIGDIGLDVVTQDCIGDKFLGEDVVGLLGFVECDFGYIIGGIGYYGAVVEADVHVIGGLCLGTGGEASDGHQREKYLFHCCFSLGGD